MNGLCCCSKENCTERDSSPDLVGALQIANPGLDPGEGRCREEALADVWRGMHPGTVKNGQEVRNQQNISMSERSRIQ